MSKNICNFIDDVIIRKIKYSLYVYPNRPMGGTFIAKSKGQYFSYCGDVAKRLKDCHPVKVAWNYYNEVKV